MIASATASDYARALGVVLADDQVDMAIVINVTPLLSNPIEIASHIASGAQAQDKPVVAVMMATDAFYEEARKRDDLPPVYRFPESAARALAQLYKYSAWKRRPLEQDTPRFPVDKDRVARILGSAGEGYLPAAQAFSLLEAYGIPVARWRVVDSASEVTAAAETLGFPVVVKAIAPDLVHKSDLGAVKIDLRNPNEVENAVHEIESSLASHGHRAESFLVQELVRGGHEVIFGITTDPRFGPLLMFGLGGKYVEVFRDVRFGVPPLTRTEASEMLQRIRGVQLLEGVRGEARADFDLLEEILLRVAQMAEEHPEIVELDINPFLASGERAASKALDARVRIGDTQTVRTES